MPRMKQKLAIPAFKSEAEEAEWWYKNRARLDKDFVAAAKKGKLKRLDQATLKARLVDLDPVLLRGPFIAVSWTAPSLHEIALRIKLDDRRRRIQHSATWGLAAAPFSSAASVAGRWSYPNVVTSIDRDSADLPDNPLVR